MNFYHLIIELIIDMIAVGMGIAVILRPTDNLPRLYWGIIAASIGLVFVWENVGWLFIRNGNPEYEYKDILNIEKMLEWYTLASLVSLFPLASLRPGYLNRFRLLMYLLPPIIITTVGLSYLFFNGNITYIESVDQILPNIGNLDIKLRLIIFAYSVITPLFYFIFPLINNKTFRKITRPMYLFIGFMFLLLGIYILFTLYINDIFFNGFGIASILFSILFSALYLHYENPLSSYTDTDTQQTIEKLPSLTPVPLYFEIDRYLKNTHAYTDPAYTVSLLATHFGEKESVISMAIKSGGYTGFREYINFLRLEYFREQVAMDPEKSIKEYMFNGGFNSRSTFYRLFSERYGMTPTQYIENQKD
ncbi:MAG: helix-turn-helix domain-containing protein [Candidatus Azobacteroides sp.]|nr:helix-turn-helix domain-containing protein [Candidatus Azobacteroides sp.]